MKFILKNNDTDPTRTFSQEALLTNFEIWEKHLGDIAANGYPMLLQKVTKLIRDGFDNNSPLKELEVEIAIKVNGEELDINSFKGGEYEISTMQLARQIVEKASEDLRDEQHKNTLTGGKKK